MILIYWGWGFFRGGVGGGVWGVGGGPPGRLRFSPKPPTEFVLFVGWFIDKKKETVVPPPLFFFYFFFILKKKGTGGGGGGGGGWEGGGGGAHPIRGGGLWGDASREPGMLLLKDIKGFYLVFRNYPVFFRKCLQHFHAP